MAEFPALPLWTDAYLADCSHLTDAEHGIYIQLLMLMWRSPDCRLPNDDEWLARKFRRNANAVQTHMRPLIKEFCEINGGWITQKRLLKEWKWCLDKSKKNARSAKVRWNKEKDSCERNANAMPPHPHPHPNKEAAGRSDISYLFYGKVIRLTKEDFTAWQTANPHLRDLTTLLEERDEYLAGRPESEQRSWFFSTANYLASQNDKRRRMAEVGM